MKSKSIPLEKQIKDAINSYGKQKVCEALIEAAYSVLYKKVGTFLEQADNISSSISSSKKKTILF